MTCYRLRWQNRLSGHKPPSDFSPHVVAGLALLVIQFALLSYSFPLAQLFSTIPITTVDHAFHQYQIFLALDLAKSSQIVGYDPHFAAGYIGGVTFNASAHFPAFAAWAMDGLLQPVVTYKLYVFLSALAAPLCLPFATRLLKLDRLTTWCAATLGLVLWWVSAFHWYHSVGMVSYVLIAYLSIPYCAALSRTLLAQHRWVQSILLGLYGAGAFFVHPFFPVAIAIFIVLLHLFYRSEYPLKQTIGSVTLIATVALLPNLAWIITMLSTPSLADAGAQPYQKVVDPMIIWWELSGQWHTPAMGAKIYPLLVVLAAIAGWQETGGRKLIARTFLSVWGALVLFSAFGAALPGIGALQPNRFSAMGYLFLVIPAAMGLVILFRLVLSKRPHGLPLAALVVLFPLASFIGKEFVHEVSRFPTERYGKPPPEVRGLGENNKALLDWITKNTTQDGRILFETSLGRIHDGAHIAGLLAYLSNREFIGGPYPYMFFSGFWDGYVFGKEIESIGESAFQNYLNTYNIGWIIVHSPKSFNYLKHQPGLKYITKIGPTHIFQANQPLTFFLAGQGNVSLQGRTLVVKVPKVGIPVNLSYHYTQGLHAEDGSAISPVYIGDDPQPFIKLTPRHSTTILCDKLPCRTKKSDLVNRVP